VILVARNPQSAERAAAQIRAATEQADIEAWAVDLASLSSIRDFAPRLLKEVGQIDVLLNIAGVMQTSPSRIVTPEGLEETFAVNALAPFLLTRLLLPGLELSDAARVVNVSSQLHMPGSRGKPVDFDFDDPRLELGYNPDRAYKNSKLAVLWFTYELRRRLAPSTINTNAVCPGFVPMTAAASTTGAMHFLMLHVLPHMPFATSVRDATASFVFMAADPSLEGVGGKYFCDMKEIRSSPDSYDADKARRFWELAGQLTELSPT